MNLMCVVIGYLFPILLLKAAGSYAYNHAAKKTYAYPLYFSYNYGDTLHIRISLINIPTYMSRYKVYESDYLIESKYITRYNQNIDVEYSLWNSYLSIFIALYTDTRLCNYKQLILGYRAQWPTSQVTDVCTNTKSCIFLVDLKNKCEEESVQNNYCHETESNYILCESTHDDLRQDSVHQWYQVSDKNITIGNIPPTTASKTKFIFKLQHFDINTYIYRTLISKAQSKRPDLTTPKTNVVFANYSIEDDNITTLMYSDSKGIVFDCREYLTQTNYVQIGFINKTWILTYNVTTETINLNKEIHGAILCCVYYLVQGTDKLKKIIRFVEKKTLLVYDANSKFEKETVPYSSITTLLLIVAAVVATVIIIMLIIIISIRKLRCKRSQPEETLELETFARNDNNIIYAEIDHRRRGSQQSHCPEEPEYATIIGVLKPSIKNGKKNTKKVKRVE